MHHDTAGDPPPTDHQRSSPGRAVRWLAAAALAALAGATARPAGAAQLFKYDARNRLYQTTTDDVVVRYLYDGADNLVASCNLSVDPPCVLYILDESTEPHRVIGEIRGDVHTLYAYGPSGLLARRSDGGGVEYALTDHQGSVRGWVDGGGNVVARFAYDAFGRVRREKGPGGSLQYTGELTGPDGVVWLRARHYHPGIGRFLQRDTFTGSVSEPLSLNRYTYVENNPFSRVDPTGHFAVDVEMGLQGSLGATDSLINGVANMPGAVWNFFTFLASPYNEMLGQDPVWAPTVNAAGGIRRLAGTEVSGDVYSSAGYRFGHTMMDIYQGARAVQALGKGLASLPIHKGGPSLAQLFRGRGRVAPTTPAPAKVAPPPPDPPPAPPPPAAVGKAAHPKMPNLVSAGDAGTAYGWAVEPSTGKVAFHPLRSSADSLPMMRNGQPFPESAVLRYGGPHSKLAARYWNNGSVAGRAELVMEGKLTGGVFIKNADGTLTAKFNSGTLNTWYNKVNGLGSGKGLSPATQRLVARQLSQATGRKVILP